MTDIDLAAIEADIAKYPARQPPHDPVTYCRQLLAALRDAEAREARLREALPSTSRRVLMRPERQYLDAMEEQFSILVGSLRDEHLREHAQIGLDAARAVLASTEPAPTDPEAER